MRHAQTTWSAVSLVTAHRQFNEEVKPHLFMDESKRPTPVHKPLSLTQDVMGNPIPRGLELVLGMKT